MTAGGGGGWHLNSPMQGSFRRDGRRLRLETTGAWARRCCLKWGGGGGRIPQLVHAECLRRARVPTAHTLCCLGSHVLRVLGTGNRTGDTRSRGAQTTGEGQGHASAEKPTHRVLPEAVDKSRRRLCALL